MFSRSCVFVVALVCSMLAGCAAPHSDLLYKDRPMVSEKEGLIVASLGYRNSEERLVNNVMQRPAIHLAVQSKSGGTAQKIQVSTQAHMFAQGAWRDEDYVRPTDSGRRVLVGYKVPAGNYEVVEQRVELYGGSMTWSARPQRRTPLVFTVAPGQITYIGAHVLQTESGKNWLGMAVPAQARLDTLDEFDEDMGVLRRVRPELRDAVANDALRVRKPD
ncbi:hypothetical protein [Variovorax sp. KBW07]|uniref:hypothetical protein n=1 Tax=Variovorax sp. KBW07 TaxID=2153358 RepID=UPI000F55F01C|nr:hypothetical protein [Variovorax sp. KBW07]